MQSLTPFLVESLVRLLRLFVSWPAASVTTILYYGEALPRNPRLQRLVRDELLDDDNFLFHFLIAMFRCFCSSPEWNSMLK
ncbi:hypothetical protein OPV22_014047 [Ensete ventricosum]|uniref:Uncharacterized protein n=1 Tax=Ensete ventricosum TaxID=4639 RepID=A0AAV8R6A1_ENSVE|nr:hypothetical protein OPV22_014047 [Ensete ventricosum]